MHDLATTTTIVPAHALEALRRKAAMADIAAWKPEPGDTLEAVIVGWRHVAGPFGAQWQAITQTATDGRLVAVWLTDWLRGELKKQHAERGDLLSLTFRGRARSKRGAHYNAYSVTILKPGEVKDSV